MKKTVLSHLSRQPNVGGSLRSGKTNVHKLKLRGLGSLEGGLVK